MRRRIHLLLVASLLAMSLGATATPAAAAANVQEAEVIIDQPTYVDSGIETDQTGNGTIHHVSGDSFRIWLESVNHDDVESWGIAEGAGSLEYDRVRDYWRFTPDGNGTMSLYWIEQTEREREVQTSNGTEVQTETVDVRHETTVQVDTLDWTHRPRAEDREIQRAADNWSSVERQVERNFPDRGTNDVVSAALTKEIFFASPFSSFFADMQAVVIMLTMRPGGLAILGTFLATFLVSSYGLLKFRNRAQKQLRDERTLEEEIQEVEVEKTKTILNQHDHNDLFPDDISQSMRDLLGSNPWVASKQYCQIRGPLKTKGTILQLMGQVGYDGRVETDDDGDVLSAWVIHEDGEAGSDIAADGGAVDGEPVDLTQLDDSDRHDRAIIEAIPGDQLDLSIFDQPERLDPTTVSLPIDNRDVDDADLLEELQPQFPYHFDDEAHMAECLGRLMQFVENHPAYTDPDGNVRDGQDLLNWMAEMDTVLADEADFPLARAQRRVLYYIADTMDPEGRLEEQIEDTRQEGVTGS